LRRSRDPVRRRPTRRWGVFIDSPVGEVTLRQLLHASAPRVAFVTDRGTADVYAGVRPAAGPAGDTLWTIVMVGQSRCAGIQDTLTLAAGGPMHFSRDRIELSRRIALGLVRYQLRANATDGLSIQAAPLESTAGFPAAASPWICQLGGNGTFSGESHSSSASLNLNVSLNRVTGTSKAGIAFEQDQSGQTVRLDDAVVNERSHDQNTRAFWIRSLGEHWSAGWTAASRSNSFENVAREFRGGPALEYNLFPYRQAAHQECRMLYQLSLLHDRYLQPTVFASMEDHRLAHSLTLSLIKRQVWGQLRGSVEAGQFLRDPRKNHLDARLDAFVDLGHGVGVAWSTNYSRVHDQLNLAGGLASADDLLLRRREVETAHRYSTQLGLTYTIGGGTAGPMNTRFGI
jgi:hypothetical protein